MIYLDYNATTPTDRRVLEAMIPYFCENYGNPSSIHSFGQLTRKAIEEARESVAELINAQPEEIIFTSGGTESNNIAIKGIAYVNRDHGNHIITSQIEHHAVLNVCNYLEEQGFQVSYLPVDRYGIIDTDELRKMITDQTILITIMHANNEVGSIQPIEEVAKIAKEQQICFHTDAVQTCGKLPIDVEKVGIDALSLSGHKFYGPKGIGALYVRKGIKFTPLHHGGHHERNRRAGTENVPGIVGLGKAAVLARNEMTEESERIVLLRDRLEKGIFDTIPDVILCGHPQHRLFNTLSICVKYVEGESMLLNLDIEGIGASSGSACASGSLEPSHVLLAIGIPKEDAHGSLRFSLGKYNTVDEINRVIAVLPDIVTKLRAMSPFSNK